MMLYSIIKSVHIISDIVWIGGMLSLANSATREDLSEKEREATLEFDSQYTQPAMLLAWAAGLWLSSRASWWLHPWWRLKFALVVAMSAFHGGLAARVRKGSLLKTPAVAVVLTILAVVVPLVVLKPTF